jgi:epoxyqueuosine reductase
MNEIPHPTRIDLSGSVKKFALENYFDACGIASADHSGNEQHLHDWLDRGYAADMEWMPRTREVRNDVQLKLEGARSVIVLAKNYYTPRPEAPDGPHGKVSRYAWGRDYHRALRKPLIRLARHIESLAPETRTYSSIDTGPVLERTWAARAGVGSIGKNSLALRRDMGSWFFLATILTTLDLEPDAPAMDICGTCTACLDACPPQAIVEPQVVDSNRCISYQTIENRGDVPSELQATQEDWMYGCDICQDVCPWNRFEIETDERDFHARPNHANPTLEMMLRMDEDTFNKEFEGTPIRRTGHISMQRNAKIVQQNGA